MKEIFQTPIEKRAAGIMKQSSQPEEKEAKETQNLDRQSEIYNKTLDLFIKNGYDVTSMSMIAETLGMSKANLYYYCPTKEGLLYQIHLDDLQRRLIPIIEEAEKLSDPQECLTLFLRKFTLMCTSSPASRVLVHEIRILNKSHQNEIKLIWRRAYKLIRGAIEELQKLGRACKFRGSFLTLLGVGMPFWIIYWWDYSRQGNAEELAETLVQIFLNGLLNPGKKGF